MGKLGRAAVLLASVAASSVVTHARRQPPPLLVATSEDSVYILLLDPPRDMRSFAVYRKGPSDRDFVLVTQQPIEGVRDPLVFREMLGREYRWVARTVKARDEFQALRRIRSSRGNMVALSLASRRVAGALGRFFVDGDLEGGRTYIYRVSMLNYGGDEIKSVTQRVKVGRRDIRPPSRPTARAGDGNVVLSWSYPQFSGRAEDNVVAFNVYRETKGERRHRANRVPIMRQDGRLSWTDRGVRNGVVYTYYLTAMDFTGAESKVSDGVKATPKDTSPPFAPRDVRIIEGEGQITVVWRMNLELDLSHYDVFRSYGLNEEYVRLNREPIPGDQPQFTDTGLTFGPTYFYKVVAYDLSGNASKFSAPAFGRPRDASPPGAPVHLRYKLIGHTVRLNWKPPEDRDLSGYYVYRKEPDGTTMRIVKRPLPKDSLTFHDSGMGGRGLWPGKLYTYAVACVDNAHNIGPKAQVAVLVPDDEPPAAPLSLRGHTTPEGYAVLLWQPSPSLDVVGYRIYRGKAAEGKPPKPLASVADSVLRYLDTGVRRGTEYVYRIAAVDGAGNLSPMTDGVVVVPRDALPPPRPTQVRAVLKEDGVHILWRPVEAEDLKGYNIYRAEKRSGRYRRVNVRVVTETEFVDAQGREGHYYKVTSEDTSGREDKGVKPVRAIGREGGR